MVFEQVFSNADPVNASFDPVAGHESAFRVMAILLIVVLMVRVSTELHRPIVKIGSFVNNWMALYVVSYAILMSLTTIFTLALLFDSNHVARVPNRAVSLAAGIIGVFGFDIVFQKFVIGFGEQKSDLDSFLQGLMYQAVEATLERDAP